MDVKPWIIIIIITGNLTYVSFDTETRQYAISSGDYVILLTKRLAYTKYEVMKIHGQGRWWKFKYRYTDKVPKKLEK